MYRGLDLARDTYHGLKMRPVVARPVVQPVAASPVDSFLDSLEAREDALEYRWYERSARVSSLVGTLTRAHDTHTHIFDLGMCITCNKRER